MVALMLPEVLWLVYYLFPETKTTQYDLFLSRDFKYKLSVLWYIYELGAILNKIIWAFVLAKVSKLVSVKLFRVASIFCGYYFIQFFLYIWNRNTSALVNLVLYFSMVTICVIEMVRRDKKAVKVISMQ